MLFLVKPIKAFNFTRIRRKLTNVCERYDTVETVLPNGEDGCEGGSSSTIMMRDTAVDNHIEFRKELNDKYMYQCTLDKISYFVYSMIEILCFQFEFLGWEDLIIRK